MGIGDFTEKNANLEADFLAKSGRKFPKTEWI
jgi:hypothetical protein